MASFCFLTDWYFAIGIAMDELIARLRNLGALCQAILTLGGGWLVLTMNTRSPMLPTRMARGIHHAVPADPGNGPCHPPSGMPWCNGRGWGALRRW